MSCSQVYAYVFALLLCGSYAAAAEKGDESSVSIDHAVPGYGAVPLQQLYMARDTCGKVASQRVKAILAQEDLSDISRDELRVVRAMLEEEPYVKQPRRKYSIGEQLCIGTPPAAGAMLGFLLEYNGQSVLASVACDTVSKPGLLACWCLPVSLLLIEFLGHTSEDSHTRRASDLERVKTALAEECARIKEE